MSIAPQSKTLNSNLLQRLGRKISQDMAEELREILAEKYEAQDGRVEDKSAQIYRDSLITALQSVIILGTKTQGHAYEYRIGKFENEEQLKRGLCERASPLVLNDDVRRACFDSSEIYPTREAALAAANTLYPDNTGCKVIKLSCQFPASS